MDEGMAGNEELSSDEEERRVEPQNLSEVENKLKLLFEESLDKF